MPEFMLDSPARAVPCITLYGVPHQQEERPPALLLRRPECPRRWPAPHRPTNLSGNRRALSRLGETAHGSRPPVGHHPRVRSARSTLAGRSGFRRLEGAAGDVARAALGSFHRALSLAGRYPPHLPAGTEDRGGRLVPLHHSAAPLDLSSRTFPLPGFLGRV